MPSFDEESGNIVPVVQDTDWHCVSGCGNDSSNSELLFNSILQNGAVCIDCGSTCPDCGNYFYNRSGWSHANWNDDLYCGRCTRTNFLVCDSWHNGEQRWINVNADSHVRMNGDPYCDDCMDNIVTCDDCDNYMWEDDSDHYDYCNGGGTSSNIHGYDYRPAPQFHHLDSDIANAKSILKDTDGFIRKYRQIAYLGFELEMESANQSNKGLRNAADFIVNGKGSEHLYLKSDGSLNCGFELVTHPMTLGYAMQNFPWENIALLENFYKMEGWSTHTAGLHVHVSRDGFVSDTHQAKFFMFFMMNKHFMEYLAGRSDSRWCSFGDEHRKQVQAKIKGKLHAERYIACNVNNAKTLEIRIFKSSLKPARIKMALQLVDAVVKYTEQLSTSSMMQKNGMSHNGFVAFVKDNQETYPELLQYAQTYNGSVSTDQIGE